MWMSGGRGVFGSRRKSVSEGRGKEWPHTTHGSEREKAYLLGEIDVAYKYKVRLRNAWFRLSNPSEPHTLTSTFQDWLSRGGKEGREKVREGRERKERREGWKGSGGESGIRVRERREEEKNWRVEAKKGRGEGRERTDGGGEGQ